ncbi:unnamed protein product [Rhizophagus irregularis]|nr:unnamed protein product [Rhizophagus irregularis]
MNKCWNSNPDNKPNVIELKESFNLFRDSTDNYHMEMRLRDDDEIEKQFKEAEENRKQIYNLLKTSSHLLIHILYG